MFGWLFGVILILIVIWWRVRRYEEQKRILRS